MGVPLRPAAIDEAAALLASDATRAERLARQALQAAPRDPRPALILSSALRRQKRFAEAQAILEPLARAYPDAALTQYELGLTRAALGNADAAAPLRRATQLNRDHADAWRALGDLLFQAGDSAEAAAAFAEHRRASVRDPALKPAAEAICAARLAEAEQALRHHLSSRPNDPAALQMLAEILLAQEVYADAETLLQRCLELAPGNSGARFSYANALFHQQKGSEAVPQLERLLAEDPADAASRNLMAGCLCLVGEFGRALRLYEDLLAAYDKQPSIWLNYGHALRTVGRAQAAADAYRRCIALDPDLFEAYLALANLKGEPFTAGEVAAMERAAMRPDRKSADRAALHFALAKALEDRRDYEASFGHYAEGAQLRRTSTPYDADELTALVSASSTVFTGDFFERRRGYGASAPDPIFVLGLPRAGSTLVEQILASHSQVEGTMELPDIGFAARRLGWSDPRADPAYPLAVARLTAAEATALGEGYLAATRIHRKLGRTSFVDKMPNNFQHLALIQLMLPQSRIIDVRRHPLATCFSAFKQHFAQGQAFSYDLADLGRYYRDYVALMDHIDTVLPGRVHRVIYEDLVDDTEGEVRRMLAHCGLEFEPACLAFYENDRAVRTVSSEQVRRPVFRDGLDQWRNFEPWLGPLKDALGPALATWRGR